MRRRQLDPSQRAAVTVEIEPLFAAEAKKRQQSHSGTAPGKKSLPVNLPEVINKGDARDKAAEVVGVSGKMVSDAKAIKKNNPEAFERIKSGAVTVHEAKKEIRGEEIKEIRAKMNHLRNMERSVTEGMKVEMVLPTLLVFQIPLPTFFAALQEMVQRKEEEQGCITNLPAKTC